MTLRDLGDPLPTKPSACQSRRTTSMRHQSNHATVERKWENGPVQFCCCFRSGVRSKEVARGERNHVDTRFALLLCHGIWRICVCVCGSTGTCKSILPFTLDRTSQITCLIRVGQRMPSTLTCGSPRNAPNTSRKAKTTTSNQVIPTHNNRCFRCCLTLLLKLLL